MKEHVVYKVTPGSIAEELEIESGDVLLSINAHEIEDVFDYHYYMEEEYLTVVIRKPDGEEWELEIEKDYDEDLGIKFENGLMDDYKSCHNRCIFCFIDQMPKGMRETLYFKDDDSRLSFLQGNYVTLTNMKEHDLQRIIEYHLGPINISVQTTNPQLRCKMLNNRFAGEALQKIDTLYEARIPMNGQIVLCKGVNDGEELRRSIIDLMKYMPVMESVSVVPVGLSKYREGLYPLEPFTKEDAGQVIDMIEEYQKICMKGCGLHFIHASDEWYLLAERELPGEESYDGYLQLENGVGMLRLLREEFTEALEKLSAASSEEVYADVYTKEKPVVLDNTVDCKSVKSDLRKITIATGLLAASTLTELMSDFHKVFTNIEIQIIPIENHFFGEMITVSGLLTGQDIIAQLKDKDLGQKLLLPCNLLRSGEEVFLDDITLTEVKDSLNIPIEIVQASGHDLLECLLRG